MSLDALRTAVTVVSFVVFVLIVAKTWSKRARAGWDAAAHLPLADETPEQAS